MTDGDIVAYTLFAELGTRALERAGTPLVYAFLHVKEWGKSGKFF